MLQTSSQRRYPFVYPKYPALAFSGSLPGNCSTCVAGYIFLVKMILSFPGAYPLCSYNVLFQLSVGQNFIISIIFPQPNWH